MGEGCSRCDVDHGRDSDECPGRRVGRTLDGKYKLDGLLGIGGFGAVYQATHLQLGAPFAVKTLLPRFSRQPGLAARFLREARSAASLRHPGIVRITDFGTEADFPYFVMERLEGESLSDLVRGRTRPLPIEEALGIAGSVLDALAAAHSAGIVHRDLKPQNLFCVPSKDGPLQVKILDFGLAKLRSETQGEELTETGAFLGTLQYASPEQMQNSKSVDARADVYSMGAVLFFLLTGRNAAQGTSETEVLARVVRGEIDRQPASLRPEVPPWLDRVVARALAYRPEDRFPDAAAMRAALVSSPIGPTVDLSGDEGEPARGAPSRDRPFSARKLAPVLLLLLPLAWWGGDALQRLRRPTPTPAKIAPPGMALIPAATFTMGSAPAEVDAALHFCQTLTASGCDRTLYERELPAREVTLSPYFLDRTEATNVEFATWLNSLQGVQLEAGRLVRHDGVLIADLNEDFGGLFATAGRFAPRPGRESRPVVQVTWFGADAYCRARGKRLPTEAEWELAARGGQRRAFPWGADLPVCQGVTFGRQGGPCSSPEPGPTDVGAAPLDRTPEDVRDLGGNVSEWVQDAFLPSYPPCPPGGCSDPVVEAAAPERVCRGGNWGQLAEMCRAAGRSRRVPGQASHQIGFRCAEGGRALAVPPGPRGLD